MAASPDTRNDPFRYPYIHFSPYILDSYCVILLPIIKLVGKALRHTFLSGNIHLGFTVDIFRSFSQIVMPK